MSAAERRRGHEARPAREEDEERQDHLRDEEHRVRPHEQRARQPPRAPAKRRRHRLADQKGPQVQRIADRVLRELVLAEPEEDPEEQPVERQHQQRIRRRRHLERRQPFERRQEDRQETGFVEHRLPRKRHPDRDVEADIRDPGGGQHPGGPDAEAGTRGEHHAGAREPRQARRRGTTATTQKDAAADRWSSRMSRRIRASVTATGVMPRLPQSARTSRCSDQNAMT